MKKKMLMKALSMVMVMGLLSGCGNAENGGNQDGGGDAVSTGTVIGSVGQTAASESGRASHIHYALLKEGYPVDPADYLPQR